MSDKKKIFKHSLILPTLFVIVIWLIKIYENTLGFNLTYLGILPKTFSGLIGIIGMPFIHSGFKHLISNSFPVFILAVTILYFYRGLGYRVIGIIWIMSGLLTWAFARTGTYHIGASGLVYGFASFLFFSGTLRNNRSLLAISLIVAFAYGSMIWGIFPTDQRISWEGHLMGLISGALMAYWYRKDGPKQKKWSWEIEEEEARLESLVNSEKDNSENYEYLNTSVTQKTELSKKNANKINTINYN